MNELALFTGAGGGILGGHLLGWRTVCAVEVDPYCRSVLLARQNDGTLPPFPVWDDVRTFDGRPWRGIIEVVSGGFPCQDISLAGKGAGIEGERSGLWKEMARIIGEVRPRFAFVENVAALLGRGLDVVLGDLSALGFDAEWGIVSAADAGAPHLRKRVWILAHSRYRRRREEKSGVDGGMFQEPKACDPITRPGWGTKDLADTKSKQSGRIFERGFPSDLGTNSEICKPIGPGRKERESTSESGEERFGSGEPYDWWREDPADGRGTESRMGRVVDELAEGMDFAGGIG